MSANLKAEIHDLGYRRYEGVRNPASRRWRVIFRYQLHHAWQTWWRYKLSLVLTVITTITFGALIYALRSKTVTDIDRGGFSGRFVDLLLLMSFGFFVKFAFITSMTMTSQTIANDERSGALTFYFVRSTRPFDYVLGRFAGLFVLHSFILVIPPLLLVLMRIGLASAGEDAMTNALLVPKVVLVGVLSAAAFSAVPLAFSAINKNQWMTFGLWAAWYIAGGEIVSLIGMKLAGPVAALDLAQATVQGAMKLLDITLVLPGKANGDVPVSFVPLAASLLSLALQTPIALALAMFKLRRVQGDVAGGS